MHQNQNIVLHNIKGILLDVDGTLYHQLPLRAIIGVLVVISNLYNPKELVRKLKVIIQYRKSQELMRNKEIRDDCYKNQIMRTSESTGEHPSYISDVIEEWFEKRPLAFIRLCRRRGMKKAIARWHESGIRLGVFSDYPVEDKLNALGISRFITIMVSASDRGVNGFKPNTNGFAVAARRMGLTPSDVLYVGDREEVDGIGASKAGMQVAILKSTVRKRANCNYAYIRSFHDLMKITITSR